MSNIKSPPLVQSSNIFQAAESDDYEVLTILSQKEGMSALDRNELNQRPIQLTTYKMCKKVLLKMQRLEAAGMFANPSGKKPIAINGSQSSIEWLHKAADQIERVLVMEDNEAATVFFI